MVGSLSKVGGRPLQQAISVLRRQGSLSPRDLNRTNAADKRFRYSSGINRGFRRERARSGILSESWAISAACQL